MQHLSQSFSLLALWLDRMPSMIICPSLQQSGQMGSIEGDDDPVRASMAQWESEGSSRLQGLVFTMRAFSTFHVGCTDMHKRVGNYGVSVHNMNLCEVPCHTAIVSLTKRNWRTRGLCLWRYLGRGGLLQGGLCKHAPGLVSD